MGRFLKAREAAEKLSICTEYLYQLHRRGELKAVKIGNRGIRFPEAEIQRWLASREDQTAMLRSA